MHMPGIYIGLYMRAHHRFGDPPQAGPSTRPGEAQFTGIEAQGWPNQKDDEGPGQGLTSTFQSIRTFVFLYLKTIP